MSTYARSYLYLQKEVQRFGVKPVGKKRMVKVLKDIYQQTHKCRARIFLLVDLGEFCFRFRV